KKAEKELLKDIEEERKEIAPKISGTDVNWHKGTGHSLVLNWETQALCKAGTLSIIGVYSAQSKRFPIGEAMGKNLTVKMGNCHHRKYIPLLVDLVRSGVIDPSEVLTQVGPLTSAIDAYKQFDRREPG